MQQKVLRPLGPLEQEVMNIVWELKECSIRDVREKLNQVKKLAYTTVATLLQRLFDKGLVCKKSHGIVLLYTPRVSKEIYGQKIAGSFVQTFVSSFGESAVVSFAESIDKLPKDKKDYLVLLLEKLNEDK